MNFLGGGVGGGSIVMPTFTKWFFITLPSLKSRRHRKTENRLKK